MAENWENSAKEPGHRVQASNAGEPIILTGLQLDGVSAETTRKGATNVRIWTRLSLTSEDKIFHRIAKSFAAHVEHRAAEAGHNVSVARAGFTLLVIRPDNTGELWVDAAAVSVLARMKRAIQAGGAVFESDIADVTGMSFPLVRIEKSDRVVCLFREGWRFGLFFDFNPDKNLSLSDMERDLGTLLRRVRYSDIYDAIGNELVFSRLIQSGWFPFAEIIGPEFERLASHCQGEIELDDLEVELTESFDKERLERMFARWMARPHFAGKERLLRSALAAFANQDPVPVLKIVLTEIEGILNEAYRKAHGKGAKLKKLLEFAITSAEEKSGRPDTLMFSAAFARYLDQYTFLNFDPAASKGKASSRHAVGHGAADSDSYTQVRALQALLTLDQLAFYT